MQVLLVLLSWGVAGLLLYTEYKLPVFLLLFLFLVLLTYFVYRKVSRKSMITAIIIMFILEFFQMFNDYSEVQNSAVKITQFRVIEYLLHFSVIITVGVLFLLRGFDKSKAANAG